VLGIGLAGSARASLNPDQGGALTSRWRLAVSPGSASLSPYDPEISGAGTSAGSQNFAPASLSLAGHYTLSKLAACGVCGGRPGGELGRPGRS
jgi:hypothetical protein